MASKRKPKEAVTPIEIRERVARTVFGIGPEWTLADNNGTPCFYCGGDIKTLPAYETDIAAAWQVEERIMELGLVVDYGRALQGIVRAEQGMVVNSSNIAGPINTFNTAHATPMQRCKAAINAINAMEAK